MKLQKQKDRKATKANLRAVKAAAGGSLTRVSHASFYRKYCTEANGYVYVLKATKCGEQFGVNIPAKGERDRYKEILLVFYVLSKHWGWQEPDAMALVNLIQNQFHQTGDLSNVDSFLSSLNDEREEDASSSKTNDTQSTSSET